MVDAIKLFKDALGEFHDDPKWEGAVLGKIKTVSNTKVGSVGQRFIELLCNKLAIPCSFPINKEGKRLAQCPWDIKIANIEFELKTATEDTSGNFQFNHIRYHRPYQALLCLGVSPSALFFGIWSKGDVATGKAGNLVTMEKGANASFKLTKNRSQLHDINSFKTEIAKFSKKFNKKNRTSERTA